MGLARVSYSTTQTAGSGFDNVVDMADYADLQTAIDALPAAGGTVIIPSGTEVIDTTVTLKDNLRLEGAPGAILQRGTATTMLGGGAYTNVTIQGITFDLNKSANFQIAVHFEGGSNLRVVDCTFEKNGTAGVDGETYMAILARGYDGLIVDGCHVTEMQMKVGGPGGASNCVVSNNVILTPFNLGISCVSSTVTDVIENINICDNVIDGLDSDGGIFVGSDGESADIDTLRNVRICGNIIAGTWTTTNAFGIDVVNATSTCKNIVITDNIVVNDGASQTSQQGIIIKQTNQGGSMEGLVISNNSVENMNLAAILVAVSGSDFIISNNRCKDTRGIRLYDSANASSGIEDAIISGNLVDSAGKNHCIHVAATNGYDVSEVQIRDNICKDADDGAATGAGIRLTVDATETITCDIRGNRCYDDGVGDQKHGIRGENSGGTVTVRNTATITADNSLSGNVTATHTGI